jgi:hypothetical protein
MLFTGPFFKLFVSFCLPPFFSIGFFFWIFSIWVSFLGAHALTFPFHIRTPIYPFPTMQNTGLHDIGELGETWVSCLVIFMPMA